MPRASDPRTSVREVTLKAILAGLVFGILFGAANAYLGLKAGLTVSTSIPIAVLSAAMFRVLSRNGGSILEANLSQTIGSASSSLASGTIFTIPALFMWGIVPTVTQVAILALLGGVLGVLAMVPLRRLLIVEADAELPYPEGRACAEVLRATESGAGGGRWIFAGIALGAVVKLALSAAHLLPEEVAVSPGFLPNAKLAIKIAPALLAVGYIVGFRSSSVMVSGSLISALVLVPLASKAHQVGTGGGDLLAPGDVKDRFIIFIGAGAVAAAAFVTVVRTAPTMVKSLAAVWKGLRTRSGGAEAERIDRDLPGPVLVGGIALLILALAMIPDLFANDLPLRGRIFAALGVALFGFIFVPVSSRLVGLIGVSSNPTSAMALITIAGTSAVFLLLGGRDLEARAAVLTVGTVVCVAASKAGDISQDLKTGRLVGATPLRQQAGQLLAAAVGCWAVALVVIAIGQTGDGFGPEGMPAPQARLMKTVVEAVLGAELPWDLLATGGGLSLVGTLAGLPALPFALGIYLPLSTMAAIFAGGCVRKLVDARRGSASGEGSDYGILCASGYVAGEGLAGVGIAGWAFAMNVGRQTVPAATGFESVLAFLVLLATGAVLYRSGRSAK
jgi:putative OPT family oligopeptide transporter